MMDVMVTSIVRCDMLQGIEREGISAVIIDGFDGGSCEEPHALTRVHTGNLISYTCTKGIEEKSFEWVVVQGAVSVWHVEAVVVGMKRC